MALHYKLFFIILLAYTPCKIFGQNNLPDTSISPKPIFLNDNQQAAKSLFVLDSTKKEFLKLIRDSIPVSEIKRILSEKIKPLKATYSLDKLKSIKNIPGDLFKKPLQFNGLSISMQGYYANESYDSLKLGSFMSNSFDADVSVLGIPLTGKAIIQYYSESKPDWIFNATTNYSREEYLQVLRDKLKGKINPEDFLPKDFNPVDILKAEAENLINREINNIRARYGDILNNQLSMLGDPASLFSMDMNAIRQKIMSSGFLDSVARSQHLIDKLQDEKILGRILDTSDMNQANEVIRKYKATMDLVTKIKSQYDKWNESGLLDAIRKNELLKNQKVNELLKNPDLVMKLAKEKLNLGGFQRMMMNFNNISIGQQTLNQSPLSMQGMFANGLQMDMLKNNKYLSAAFGKQKTFNSLLDMPFSSNIMSNDFRYGGFTFGKGLPNGQHSHFTFMSFGQNASMNTFGVNPVMVPRRSITTTFSKAFNTGKTGMLTFDVSKSANQFRNEMNPTDSSLVTKNPFSNLLEGNFIDNMAFTVQHEGYWKEGDLQHSIMVRATGRNYQNPGAAFIPAGSKEVLAFFKKSFLKKKLQISLRENIREYSFGSSTGNKWRNMQTSLDVKWKMRKGQYFSLRYTPTSASRFSENMKISLNATQRLSAEFNYRTKLCKLNYTHFMNLAYQQTRYTGVDYLPMAFSSVLITSLQTVQVGSKSLFCNLNLNRVQNSSDLFYLNSSVNTDLGMQYLFLKKISFSTAVNVNGVSGWYSQVGIKQTVVGQLNDHLSFSAYVDMGKNIKVERPMYNNTFRTDFSLQYVFGK